MGIKINLTHNAKNLVFLLKEIVSKKNSFTHEDFANWCMVYADNFREVDFSNPVEQSAYEVADDIDAQWELYLVNTYTLEQLQGDRSKITVPDDWFKEWLVKLNYRGTLL